MGGAAHIHIIRTNTCTNHITGMAQLTTPAIPTIPQLTILTKIPPRNCKLLLMYNNTDGQVKPTFTLTPSVWDEVLVDNTSKSHQIFLCTMSLLQLFTSSMVLAFVTYNVGSKSSACVLRLSAICVYACTYMYACSSLLCLYTYLLCLFLGC